MTYYKVTDNGDMQPYSRYDGRKKKYVSYGFLLKGELYTEKERLKMSVGRWDLEKIELKKNQVKKYRDGGRYEKTL